MDFAKFVSLLSTRSLYFAAQDQFEDPFEGYLPESHYQALEKQLTLPFIQSIQTIIKKMIESNPEFENSVGHELINQCIENFPTEKEISEQTKNKFGVSCWHINEYENEAMWKIYSAAGQGIAIESTVERLERSLTYHNKIHIDKVRYEDFDTAQIEKGHKYYSGFIKGKAFLYENELRAVAVLDEENYGKGCSISSDLELLICKIYISPLMPEYFYEAVRYVSSIALKNADEKIIRSKLLNKP